VLQTLDRLTWDEARTTTAQTFHIVYGLVQNMSPVIDGERFLTSVCLLQSPEHLVDQTAKHLPTVFGNS
jgi:hypothetical protein